MDDFSIISGTKDAKKVLSYGQCKVVALLMTFAGAFYTKDVSGDYPVLLLDDLESDLDERNIASISFLIQLLEQVFISSSSVSRLALPGPQVKIEIDKENRADGVSAVLGAPIVV